MENNFHFPSFGPKDNLFPHVEVSKGLDYYIRTNRKDIMALSKMNEATIQKFIKIPTKDIKLTKHC